MGMNDDGPATPSGEKDFSEGLLVDERFTGRTASDTKRAVGTFFGVWGGVTGLATLTLGFYTFGPDTWLTRGPLAFSAVAVVVWFLLSYRSFTERMSQRAAQYVGLTVGYTGALIALLAGGHYLLANDPITIDFSAAGVHSLSDQTQGVLSRLDTEVVITGFYEKTDPYSGTFDDFAKRFQRESDKVKFRRYSPSYDIEQVKEYKVTADTPPIVVEAYKADPTKRRETRFALDKRSLNHEERFTNAIIAVTLAERKRVLVTTGHGESDPLDASPKGFKSAADDLRQEGYDVIRVNLVEMQRVPENTAAVLIPGPTQRFLDPERKTLTNYLAEGGRVGVFLEQGSFEHGLDEVLAPYGVQANKDLVLDVSEYGRAYGATNAIATSYAEHPITAKFMRTTSLFPEARSISVNPVPDVTTIELVRTTEKTWGETDIESIARGDAAWDEGEARGPVTLAVVAERSLAKNKEDPLEVENAPKTRLVVTGDASFTTNEHRRLGANRNLALNMIGWLTDDEDRIAIRPKSRGSNLIVLTPNQRDGIAFFVLYVLPIALLSTGLGIWLVRRQR